MFTLCSIVPLLAQRDPERREEQKQTRGGFEGCLRRQQDAGGYRHRAQARVTASASGQEDGRIQGAANKRAVEEVCWVMRFPPEALYGGRVGVKEAEAGSEKWSLGEERSRREERGRTL